MLSRRLKYFMAIVENGGFRSASLVIGVSQAALTRAIKELETDLGVSVFERLPRGVRLTRDGQILARRARSILLEERHARIELETTAAERRSLLRIGAGPIWECRYLPSALARLQQRHPNISVHVQIGLSSRHHPLLEAGELDVCLGATDGLELDPARFHTRSFGRFDLAAFVRAGHELAFKGEPTTVDLQAWPWVFYAGDFERVRDINRRLQTEGLPPIQANFVANSMMMAFHLGATSDAIVCAAAAFADEAHRYSLVQLPVVLGSFHSAGWLRNDIPRSFAAERMLAYLSSAIGIAAE